MTVYEFQPNYLKLREFVNFILSCFTKIWEIMCRPFIDDYYFTWSGGRYEPTWSYLVPLLAIGFTFIIICFAKKLITKLMEGV